ncbi:two-component regulator propeller domain-containing protein [Algoriphagus kandeliae]|uniref:two-component regulator propeller domain-containing protein n=1 Tax=Algoriphagus kandeliae TaxID=2562278 RepID=UPI001386D9E8|nr:two-component regulator propeller domain-containing protein [Algoriphagus kandeliae]
MDFQKTEPPIRISIRELAKEYQPEKIPIAELVAPEQVFLTNYSRGGIEPPQRNDFKALRNEDGSVLLDSTGKAFILGEGGIAQFKKYTSDEGLPIDGVNCALVDSRGHIWFGTAGGGVSRFDGLEFFTYTESQGLGGNAVRDILEDSQGNLWFGTVEGGVSKFDGVVFQNFGYNELGDDIVYTLSEDKEGNIWMGTDGAGLIQYDGNDFSPAPFNEELGEEAIISLATDADGILWIGTNGSGFFSYDGENLTSFGQESGLPSNRIRAIFAESPEKIWVGTLGGGVCRLEGGKFTCFTQKDGLAGNVVRAINQDSEGWIWIATETGVSRFEGDQIISYTTEQGLAGNSVLDIVKDQRGKLWFCTDGGGVSRLDGLGFTSYTNQQGLAGNIVLTSTEDHEGNLWFGTNGWGVSKYDGRSFTTYSSSQGLSGDIVYSLLEDQQNRIWFGTSGDGLSILDGNQISKLGIEQGPLSNEIYSLFESQSGDIWIGTDYGVSRFDGESFQHFTKDQGLIGEIITSIEEDSEGIIWFGVLDGGISRYDGESFVNFGIDQGLIDPTVVRLEMDESKNLWIGTTHGLSILPREIQNKITSGEEIQANPFESFNTEDGLPDNFILQIVDLPGKAISLGTNQGITRLEYHPEQEPKLRNFEIFNSDTGFPVKDLTDGQNGMLLDSKGLVWAGTGSVKTGLVRMDPSRIQTDSTPPIVEIKQVRLNEEVVPWHLLAESSGSESFSSITDQLITLGRRLPAAEKQELKEKFEGVKMDGITPFIPIPENLELPYRHNQINIEFSTNELAKPYLIEYQHILEGYESDWSPILRRTSATFGNIQEGDYTFRVRARYAGNSIDQPSEWSDVVTFSFTILPPWYRSWWAYAFYLVLFLSLIYPMHLFQKNRLLKAERERAKERELAHAKEIEKAYQELNQTHENLKATQSQLIQAEKMASLGELTAGIAHEIQNPLNFVKNFSEVSHELMDEMNEEIQSGDYDEAKSLAQEIKENLDRISLHSMRADAIVKAMLQHSKASVGNKEPTDINALADECLRLSYHGVRAKEPDFKADYSTELEPNLPEVEVIRKEIGRILINICNNAFYAVHEKSKETEDPNYIPRVKISTHRTKKGIEIKITDNGTGIPQDIIGKIFQPFFTTKPTGFGTGLGLSLSYDTVKSYQGELTAESKTGSDSYTTFTIFLPLNSTQKPEVL